MTSPYDTHETLRLNFEQAFHMLDSLAHLPVLAAQEEAILDTSQHCFRVQRPAQWSLWPSDISAKTTELMTSWLTSADTAPPSPEVRLSRALGQTDLVQQELQALLKDIEAALLNEGDLEYCVELERDVERLKGLVQQSSIGLQHIGARFSGSSGTDQERWSAAQQAILTMCDRCDQVKEEVIARRDQLMISLPLSEWDEQAVALFKARLSNDLSPSRPFFIESCRHNFLAQIDEAASTAVALHEMLQEVCKGVAEPVYDAASGTVLATASQFRAAQSILQEYFPRYIQLAFDDSQRCAVARLFQCLLCGRLVPLPSSTCCVALAELRGVQKTLSFQMAERSFLTTLLDWPSGVPGAIKKGAVDKLHLFFLDNIQRANSFSLGATRFDCKPEPAERYRQAYEEMLKRISEHYLHVLFAQPDQMVATFQQLKTSEFWNQMGTAFDCPLADHSLQEMCDQLLRALETVDPSSGKGELQVLATTLRDMRARNAEPIAGLMADCHVPVCSMEEIQAMLTLKVLEVMLLANQCVSLDALSKLEILMRTWKGAEGKELYEGINSMLSTTRNFSHDLTSFEQVTRAAIRFLPDALKAAGIREEFEEHGLPVFEVDVGCSLPAFNQSARNRVANRTWMANVGFSYPLSAELLDRLLVTLLAGEIPTAVELLKSTLAPAEQIAQMKGLAQEVRGFVTQARQCEVGDLAIQQILEPLRDVVTSLAQEGVSDGEESSLESMWSFTLEELRGVVESVFEE